MNEDGTPIQTAEATTNAPVDTNSDVVETTEAEQTETKNEQAEVQETAEAQESTETQETTEESTETTETEDYVSAEELAELQQLTQYQPDEMEVDLVDEYGYIDPAKLQNFMAENNQRVFEKAVTAVKAQQRAETIETKTWERLHNDYPELKENPTLETALRGARIADMVAGGDGDLRRIAQDFMKPIRDNKVKAVEDVNRKITQQESLETFTPETASPEEKPAPSLMSQLQTALRNGDQEEAQRLRHAIRKERIHDTTKR